MLKKEILLNWLFVWNLFFINNEEFGGDYY